MVTGQGHNWEAWNKCGSYKIEQIKGHNWGMQPTINWNNNQHRHLMTSLRNSITGSLCRHTAQKQITFSWFLQQYGHDHSESKQWQTTKCNNLPRISWRVNKSWCCLQCSEEDMQLKLFSYISYHVALQTSGCSKRCSTKFIFVRFFPCICFHVAHYFSCPKWCSAR